MTDKDLEIIMSKFEQIANNLKQAMQDAFHAGQESMLHGKDAITNFSFDKWYDDYTKEKTK